MSVYLQIAENILRSSKRPLSARSILKQAYIAGIVPYNLHGKTQHKTLQARLSEDILHRKEHSLFFRTKPGQFFLREFLIDTSIPQEFRQPIVARRRTRDLFLGSALVLNYKKIKDIIPFTEFSSSDLIEIIQNNNLYDYIDPKTQTDEEVLLWAVSALTRSGKVLSYRVGKYRDSRDSFAHKRSIAFSTLVSETSNNLFDMKNLGIIESAIAAIATDLDIPYPEAISPNKTFEHELKFLAWQPNATSKHNMLAFIEVKAPDWFEPTINRLSLNDLCWIDIKTPPNNWLDFDPWSQKILSYFFPEAQLNA